MTALLLVSQCFAVCISLTYLVMFSSTGGTIIACAVLRALSEKAAKAEEVNLSEELKKTSE